MIVITIDEAISLKTPVSVVTSDGIYYTGKIKCIGYSSHDDESHYEVINDEGQRIFTFGSWSECSHRIIIYKDL